MKVTAGRRFDSGPSATCEYPGISLPTDPGQPDTEPETEQRCGSPASGELTNSSQGVVQTQTGDGTANDDSELVGRVIGERYRIVELLGRGGMGAVYRADHIHIRKSFALKILHPELTHHVEAVKRFEREAIAAARIDHPNVATAIDFGNLSTGEFYLVLDYVQGQSLRQLLEQQRVLPEARAIRIARQIAAALSAAHAASVVHRDLKPDNVMLVESSAEPDFVKVLDFGIAKVRSDELAGEPQITRFGTIFGTPEYMSPEQALGQNVDARSDLYSLGILLYEMLSGKTPFADEQLVIVLSRQMTECPAPIAGVSPELGAIVMRLLEKRPEARFATAEGLIAEFDSLPASRRLALTSNDRLGLVSAEPIGTTDTLLAIPAAAGPLPSALQEPHYSLPPWLKRQVTVRGRKLPWVLLAIAGGLVAATILLTITVSSLVSPTEPASSATRVMTDLPKSNADKAELQRIMRLVTLSAQGDAAALLELEKQPPTKRRAIEWAAIGAGRAASKRFPEALEAYSRAFDLDPKGTATPQAAGDLFQAALVPSSSDAALELATRYLGPRGPDLIYAVLDAIGSGRAPKLDKKRIRKLLDSELVRKVATEPLLIALSLDEAKTCQDFKQVLPRAKTSADERSLRVLRRLTYDRGCGFLDLGDCYSCLRGSRALTEAIETAKLNAPPRF